MRIRGPHAPSIPLSNDGNFKHHWIFRASWKLTAWEILIWPLILKPLIMPFHISYPQWWAHLKFGNKFHLATQIDYTPEFTRRGKRTNHQKSYLEEVFQKSVDGVFKCVNRLKEKREHMYWPLDPCDFNYFTPAFKRSGPHDHMVNGWGESHVIMIIMQMCVGQEAYSSSSLFLPTRLTQMKTTQVCWSSSKFSSDGVIDIHLQVPATIQMETTNMSVAASLESISSAPPQAADWVPTTSMGSHAPP